MPPKTRRTRHSSAGHNSDDDDPTYAPSQQRSSRPRAANQIDRSSEQLSTSFTTPSTRNRRSSRNASIDSASNDFLPPNRRSRRSTSRMSTGSQNVELSTPTRRSTRSSSRMSAGSQRSNNSVDAMDTSNELSPSRHSSAESNSGDDDPNDPSYETSIQRRNRSRTERSRAARLATRSSSSRTPSATARRRSRNISAGSNEGTPGQRMPRSTTRRSAGRQTSERVGDEMDTDQEQESEPAIRSTARDLRRIRRINYAGGDVEEELEEPTPRRSRVTRSRITGQENRDRRHQTEITADPEEELDVIRTPNINVDMCLLKNEDGTLEMQNRCPFCGALHFAGERACCFNGRIFVPPMRKLPLQIYNLMFRNDKETTLVRIKRFKKDILTLNSCFAVGSVQRNRVLAAPFGEPVEKTLGVIRHFPSAVKPNDPNTPRYGNLYLYQGENAVNLRMEGFQQLDDSMVREIQRCMEYHYPFAKMYKTMGELMDQEERDPDGDDDRLRLRIVDANLVPEEYLQGNHKGLYRDPLQCGDYVALFFTASKEQDVVLPGLNVFPRKHDKEPMPIFYWDPKVNAFCYPLLFPRGELGWMRKHLNFARDPKQLYEDRLKEFAEGHPAIAREWEVEVDAEELIEHPLRYTAGGDPNIEASADEDEEDQDDHLGNVLHEIESATTTGRHVRVETVERGGEIYPRIPSPTRRATANNDQANADADEDPYGDMVDDEDQLRRRGEHPPRVRRDPSADIMDEDLLGYEIENELLDAIEEEEYPIHTGELSIEDALADLLNINADEEVVPEGEHQPQQPNAVSEEEPRPLSERVRNIGKRQFTSLREWTLFVYQKRTILVKGREGDPAVCYEDIPNRFCSSGKLGQLFLLDMCTRMYQQRHSGERAHHTEYLTTTKHRFLDAINRSAARREPRRTIGCVASVPHTVPGSPRYQKKLFEHTVAMARQRNSKPDLFITATANVYWPEIKDNLADGETWADRPFLVAEVFKKKFEKLLNLIVGDKIEKNRTQRKDGLFGKVRWYSYSIEFQQRGPPHAHLVVSLKNHITTADQIDRVCQAVLPKCDNPKDESAPETILRKLVEDLMVHRPCENDPEAYCRANARPFWKTCKKHFPKEFTDTTRFGDRNYPELKRPNDGEFVMKGDKRADNRHVVPYNTELLMFFRSHVNVEVVSNLRVVKYIFKYLFKGYDRVLVEAITSTATPNACNMTIEGHLIYPRNLKIPAGAKKQREIQASRMLKDGKVPLVDNNGRPTLVYDEYTMIEDQRAITACEAAWDFAYGTRHGESHSVVDLCVHGEGQEPISYKEGEEEQVERRVQEEWKTMFTAWFKLNETDANARSLTYEEIPRYYRYQNQKWIAKKRTTPNVLGRIRSVHPRNQEVFAIRLLSTVQKGATSYEELRTVGNVVHPTFVAAAKALRLMNDQQEWERTLTEASEEKEPVTLRRMFASILLFNAVENPLQLWETMTRKKVFYQNDRWTDERNEAYALRHINSFLVAHLSSLEEFGLPAVNEEHLPPQSEWDDDSGESNLTQDEATREARNHVLVLNEEQRAAFDKITQILEDPNSNKIFFLEGSGGTGKTRLMTALYYELTKKNHKVYSVAHTGVAAKLLPYGSTAHRAFHIPMMVEENMHCSVDQDSDEAVRIEHVDVVLWDEATMSDRRILHSVHRLLASLHPESGQLFGGVAMIFGGDWKQTLPIVEDVRGPDIVNYTMLGSELWDKVEVIHLEHNMRAQHDPDFAEWIAAVGRGEINIETERQRRREDQEITLDYGTFHETEEELITAMYGTRDTPENKRHVFEKSCILAVDNRTTFDINNKVLRLIDSPEKVYNSVDEHDPTRGFYNLDPDVYHGETPSGFPLHELKVKKGAIVILLRNISTKLGLVNGTRMIIEEIGEDVIWAKPLGGNKYTPDRWPLHRMRFSPTTALSRETSFTRTQFPIRLAFSMTCNKAQGQTLERCGLLLRTPCFAHGQLYVALSRVRKASDLHIYNSSGRTEPDPEVRKKKQRTTNNVVYDNAFKPEDILNKEPFL